MRCVWIFIVLITSCSLFFLSVTSSGGNENQVADQVQRRLAMGEKANRLIKEKSPYLLQHAFNPVNWYPWGEEAFALAKKK